MKHHLLALAALFFAAMGTKAQTRVSVHDPSIVDAGTGTYYIFGSHQAWAKTTDLQNWATIPVNWGDGTCSNINCGVAFNTQKVTQYMKGGTAHDFANFDAEAWSALGNSSYSIDGNLWAPDVIWNPVMNKWCMYLSINGDNANCSIMLLTADEIEGPYIYQAPVVVSGFYNTTFDYKKTDLEQVIGEQSSLPERYAVGNLSGWRHRWPNAIDPCVFYDEEGKLWMSYGSWHGGIFILELDETTGLRDYDVTYPETIGSSADDVRSDPYYGTKIAGGFQVSGEASYIKHIGDYYYLFVTYGGLVANGGYQMRVFRSSNPDGPYEDSYHTGGVAIYNAARVNYGPDGTRKTDRGENIFGAYGEWGSLAVGDASERSQGHNSVLVSDGRTYLVYHTRFQNRDEYHEVRVHQMWLNQDGWLCAAPFEYSGETTTDADIAGSQTFSDDEVAGSYKLLIHTYNLDHVNKQLALPVNIKLESGGAISGDVTGSWSTESGTSYITLTINDIEYKGVVVEQTIDGTSDKTVCFTAYAGKKGYTVWGYQLPKLTTIGAEDNSTPWWTAFSDIYTVEPGKTLKLRFKNYSSKAQNWSNWATRLTNGDFSTEYLIMRADCYGVTEGGWGDEAKTTNSQATNKWFTANLNNYDWDNFKTDLDGADVELTIKRLPNSSDVILCDNVTTSGGKKFTHYFVMSCGNGSQDIKVTLTVDQAHIIIGNDATTIEDTETVTGTLAGVENNTGDFGTGARTDYPIKPNETLTLQFVNYSNRIANWNNWVLEMQQGTNYLDLRADKAGWGTFWNEAYCQTTGYADWDVFREEMDGANVVMTIARSGADINIEARMTSVAGREFKETYTFSDAVAIDDITARLLTEGAHLDILQTGTATGIKAVTTTGTETMYDLSGRRVDAQYKGIVIKDGKMMIKK